MAGLYIHIPFCGRRCGYCDFYSTTLPDRVAAFLEAVKREMTDRRSFLPVGRLDTIYVGGGTPSLLAPEQLQGLLDHAASLWDCSGLREVTLEANPEDLADDYLARLSGTEFNRLSIGIQSFDDGMLRLMNRRHDAARACEAVRAAQAAGFDNISIDLIYGISGMTDAQWERSLDEAASLGVQHISAYHLTIEPGTAFGRQGLEGIDDETSERQFAMLREKLGGVGFEHYEISNFALPGRRAIHNSAYWSGRPYLGVGPSAHSFDGDRRREWVVADLVKYISGPTYDGETLSDLELANERIMTGLRTAEGIAAAELGYGISRRGAPPGRSNPDGVAGLLRAEALAMTSQFETIERFLREGLLVRRGDRIAIPAERFLLSDHIIGGLFRVD